MQGVPTTHDRMRGQVNNSTAAGPSNSRTASSSRSSSTFDSTRGEPYGGSSISREQGRQRRTNTGRGRGGGRNTLTIETFDFRTNFHAKLCRAAKYKVHAPYCSCPKIVKLRQQLVPVVQSLKKSNDDNDDKGVTKNMTTKKHNSYSNNQVQFDIDGNIAHQLSQLNIASNNNGEESNNTNNSNKNNIGNNDPFDNLIVLPDTKSNNPSIYVCNDTDRLTFQRNGTACEKKLGSEIFGHCDNNAITDKDEEEGGNNYISQEKITAGSASANNNNIPPFKVNCAICLLTTHQRNGFVAIVSPSLNEMQPTIQRARDAITNKVKQQRSGYGKGLHADHAHFVCALEVSSLQSLLASGNTRDKGQRVNMEILTQMKKNSHFDDDVCLPNTETTLHDMISTIIMSNESSVQIKMGHHLTSLLWLLLQDHQQANLTTSNNLQYIMVMGYIDGPRILTFDLPGGKRHLGESTLQGAIREVEEECSLIIDHGWFADRVSKRYGGDDGNNESMANIADISSGNSGEDDGYSGGLVQVLEPRKIKGSQSGDAFFVMTP
eukprot:CAMPEP_0172324782 /NCGR_PEP_ID=MMETSP1058-20130122/52319_1 /TAXON_ID=83371 /ORGANISM="Detonula confervacea, Strain CCMP 353" /LENGTH=548 /DNA_ID=CAMNT_0013041163 /DNA_START=150 /DNA_END=1793 /DNA_ORIENTATION=+